MKGIFPIDKFRTLQTPFYYYDTKVLRDTLSAINQRLPNILIIPCITLLKQMPTRKYLPSSVKAEWEPTV